jgi:hypothetical protein
MSDLVVEANAAAGSSEGFEALARINDGFLGTGSSTAVELSYVAMVLIVGYAAWSTARYFLAGTKVAETVAQVLGLREI